MWNNKKDAVSYGSTSTELFTAPSKPSFIDPVDYSPSLIRKDESEVKSEARMRVIFGQDEPIIVKYLCKELDITSDEAEKMIKKIRNGLNKEFTEYIATCNQDNIMILKTMLTSALEKKDFRNATEIMVKLDALTRRYMEDMGMIEKHEKEEEITISFS